MSHRHGGEVGTAVAIQTSSSLSAQQLIGPVAQLVLDRRRWPWRANLASFTFSRPRFRIEEQGNVSPTRRERSKIRLRLNEYARLPT